MPRQRRQLWQGHTGVAPLCSLLAARVGMRTPAQPGAWLVHMCMCAGTLKVIDFGLARRYVNDAGEVMPPRAVASFRGSTMYASVTAHADQELAPRDDLWSWLYCVVELMEGE